ncbi:MAG: tetratricopeptide repeat protein [Desulfonatronovibrionaceae bacterium]
MPQDQVPIRLDLAERYLLESEPRMALEQLLLVKEKAGDDPRLHFNLGLTYSVMNELDRAAQAYEQAVALNPSYGEAWNNLGQVEQARGNHEAAARAYEAAVDQEEYMTPEFAAYNLARLYAEQDEKKSALDWLNRGMELNSRYIPLYEFSAEIYRQEGNFARAADVLDRGVRARPDSLQLRMELAGEFLKIDREDKAKEQFRWIIEQEPESEEAAKAASYLEMLR